MNPESKPNTKVNQDALNPNFKMDSKSKKMLTELDQNIINNLIIKYQNRIDKNDEFRKKNYNISNINAIDDVYYDLKRYFASLELTNEMLENKTILDIGSAKHFFDEYCKSKYNSKVYALDLDEEHLGTQHEFPIIADVTKTIPLESNFFDLIISNASMPVVLIGMNKLSPEEKVVILRNLSNLYKESFRMLKIGGEIRFSTYSEKETESEARYLDEIYYKSIYRIKLMKESFEEFKKETGIDYEFKDEESGGLIIIKKGEKIN